MLNQERGTAGLFEGTIPYRWAGGLAFPPHFLGPYVNAPDTLTAQASSLKLTQYHRRQVLDNELATSAQACTILAVIRGLRKRLQIDRRSGLRSTNIQQRLDFLMDREQVADARRPLSTATSRNTCYEIIDPSLRFHMRFVNPRGGDFRRRACQCSRRSKATGGVASSDDARLVRPRVLPNCCSRRMVGRSRWEVGNSGRRGSTPSTPPARGEGNE